MLKLGDGLQGKKMAHALVDIRILQREYLLAISRALTAELELPDLLRIILKASVEFVSGRAGMIALAEPGRSEPGRSEPG
ncbi:MAG: hypothetical protein GY803_03150, partial [Chloroflexi bacterium]|nr:hypothetical protein [Chloroflexota bacterium]